MEINELIIANLSKITIKIMYYNKPDVIIAPGGQHSYEGRFPAAGLHIVPESYNGGAANFRTIDFDANGHPLTLTVR